MCTIRHETIRNESLKGVIKSWASRLREASCKKVTWKRMADGGKGYHAGSCQQACLKPCPCFRGRPHIGIDEEEKRTKSVGSWGV